MYIGTENVTYVEDGVLFKHKDKQNYTFFRKIDETGDDQINKYFMFSFMCGILIPEEEGPEEQLSDTCCSHREPKFGSQCHVTSWVFCSTLQPQPWGDWRQGHYGGLLISILAEKINALGSRGDPSIKEEVECGRGHLIPFSGPHTSVYTYIHVHMYGHTHSHTNFKIKCSRMFLW